MQTPSPDAAHRSEKALAMLREHAASLDPDSFVSEVIRVLEGEDEAPTAAPDPQFAVDDVLVWEPDAPHARCVVTVTKARWNGEEWWYETADIADPDHTALNDEARMVEACIPYKEWRERPI